MLATHAPRLQVQLKKTGVAVEKLTRQKMPEKTLQ
jgi:hypothetical protein